MAAVAVLQAWADLLLQSACRQQQPPGCVQLSLFTINTIAPCCSQTSGVNQHALLLAGGRHTWAARTIGTLPTTCFLATCNRSTPSCTDMQLPAAAAAAPAGCCCELLLRLHSPRAPLGKAGPCRGKGGAAVLAHPGAHRGTPPCHACQLVYTSQPAAAPTPHAAAACSERLQGRAGLHQLQATKCFLQAAILQDRARHCTAGIAAPKDVAETHA